jgi:UDP-N-acetylmuramate--alanine ligase
MQERWGLAVAGTHGKSTTAAMAAEILVAAGCDPTVIYGAAPLGGGEGGRSGNGTILLVEGCEFQRNFLHLCPREAVILNIEPDHFDCYDSQAALESAFGRFAAQLPHDGRLIVPWGDATVRRAADAAGCRVETFGCDVDADWSAGDLRSERGRYGFELLQQGRLLGRVELSVYGRHNVMNALAAAALAARSGVTAGSMTAGLSRFRGLRRRLESLGTAGGVLFWDDYAHHPTEVSATLQALREAVPAAQLFCLFPPHQSLRTERLLDELARSLQNAERVLIADIYRAREAAPRPGEVTAADLAARTRLLGQDVPGLHAPLDIQKYLQTHLTSGDLLVVMGAGDIGRIGYGLLEWFREHRAAG